MLDIEKVIEMAGGVEAVRSALGFRSPLTVRFWRRNGIPEKHWSALIGRVPGLTPEVLHAMNETLRTQKETAA
jgi:hypothetical protein